MINKIKNQIIFLVDPDVQRDIIENHPDRIEDIINFIHPDIDKEYPHLNRMKGIGIV